MYQNRIYIIDQYCSRKTNENYLYKDKQHIKDVTKSQWFNSLTINIPLFIIMLYRFPSSDCYSSSLKMNRMEYCQPLKEKITSGIRNRITSYTKSSLSRPVRNYYLQFRKPQHLDAINARGGVTSSGTACSGSGAVRGYSYAIRSSTE